MRYVKYVPKNNYKEEYGEEQNVSRGFVPDGVISDEERLYRKKEEYDAKLTLYKGSILSDKD